MLFDDLINYTTGFANGNPFIVCYYLNRNPIKKVYTDSKVFGVELTKLMVFFNK